MHQYTYVGRYKNRLLVKEVSGINRTTATIDWTPSIFYETKKSDQTAYTSPSGVPLVEKCFSNIQEFNTYMNGWYDVPNVELYGFRGIEYQYIAKQFADRDNFDHSVFKVLYFDIETERSERYGYAPASNPFNRVILITAYIPSNDKTIVWELDTKGHDIDDVVEYRDFSNDIDMIKDFFKFIKLNNIDIVSGWNIDFYDIPYLCGRLMGQYYTPGTHPDYQPAECKKQSHTWHESSLPFPFGLIKRRIIVGKYGKDAVIYEIPGIESLDYMDLYKKFTYITRESYSLNHIAYCELGEKKVDYSEHKHLQSLYEQDYDKFIEYGIKDTKLVHRLDEKLKLIDLCIALAYMVGCNLHDVHSAVKTWEIYLYNELMKDGIMPPFQGRSAHKEKEFLGAHVQDPVKGKHDWVISCDLNGLYPHIMMFANMSPDTYVEPMKMHREQRALYDRMKQNLHASIENIVDGTEELDELKKWNVAMTPNGAMFNKEVHGVLPRIVKKLYAKRKECKKLMLHKKQELEDKGGNDIKLIAAIASLNAIQMALKIMANSCYGAMGNEHFIFFNLDIAEGITAMGQVAIRYISKQLTEFLNKKLGTKDAVYVIYGDTDSCYLSLFRLVDILKKKKPDITDEQIVKAIDRFAEEQIQPFIDESYEKLKEYLNGYEQSLKMKREKIAKAALFVAKKRYTTAVIDDEGVRYDHPKIKTTGLESVRSTTPEIVRSKFKQLEETLLLGTQNEARKLVMKYRSEFKQLPIEEIAIVKSVNDIEKWVEPSGILKTGSPQQVKASWLYNKIMLSKDKHAETIKSGDKVRLVYTIKGNKALLGETCVAYPQVIPPELGLTREVVDWDKMFDVVFLSGAEILFEPLGMTVKKPTTVSLANFFG